MSRTKQTSLIFPDTRTGKVLLSLLGAGVSSLIPAFNTVTQTTSIATEGLFRVANVQQEIL